MTNLISVSCPNASVFLSLSTKRWIFPLFHSLNHHFLVCFTTQVLYFLNSNPRLRATSLASILKPNFLFPPWITSTPGIDSSARRIRCQFVWVNGWYSALILSEVRNAHGPQSAFVFGTMLENLNMYLCVWFFLHILLQIDVFQGFQ